MKKYSFALFFGLFISALVMFSPISQADTQQQLDQREQQLNQREQELNQREESLKANQQTYGAKVGWKYLSGFINMSTGILEVPKSIINTTNESGNIAYGFIGGMAKGVINSTGRILSGLTDMVMAPIPTHPIVQPNYIFMDFDSETTYGPVFRLDNDDSEFYPGK